MWIICSFVPFSSGPDLLISSVVVAFWWVWFFCWWQGQLIRMWCGPVFEVCQEILPTFESLDWKKFLELMFGCLHCLGLYVLPSEIYQDFAEIFLVWAINVFKSLAHLPSWKCGNGWFCQLQSSDCEVWGSFGKDLQRARSFKTSPWKWASLWWAILAIWKFCWIVMKISRIVDVCQLLRGQQKLVCFNRCRSSFTAVLQLTGRAVVFLLSWRSTGEAVCDFFVNSGHHVVAIFWAKVSRRLNVEDACFRMRITLGVVLISSYVRDICVSGRLRSGSSVALNKRVH